MCPFVHDTSRVPNDGFQVEAQSQASQKSTTDKQAPDLVGASKEPSSNLTDGRRFNAPQVDQNRVVSKPVPKSQVEDPRSFQIAQLRRRFSPRETAGNGGTALAFRMVPSDPDFPFEMPGGLDCVLSVPSSYPKDGRPALRVKNEDMGEEYRESVEKGFARLAEKKQQPSLLGLMNALDRQLEGLLGGVKEVEVTIFPY